MISTPTPAQQYEQDCHAELTTCDSTQFGLLRFCACILIDIARFLHEIRDEIER